MHEDSKTDTVPDAFVDEMAGVLHGLCCAVELQDLAQLLSVGHEPVSYTHLRAHETVLDIVCRLLLEKKKHRLLVTTYTKSHHSTSKHITHSNRRTTI